MTRPSDGYMLKFGIYSNNKDMNMKTECNRDLKLMMIIFVKPDLLTL